MTDNRTRAILQQALQLPEEERPAYLDRECAQDEELRRKVEKLLEDDSRLMFGDTVSLQGPHVASDPTSRLEQIRSHASAPERYQLKGRIGRGGQGAVYEVWDEDLSRRLAMKVVLGKEDGASPTDTPPADPATLSRFLEEAQITGQLDHPGVVPVHELGVDPDGHVFFTMRLVKGDDFSEIIRKVHAGEDGWTQIRALGVILKACEAMAYAHDKGVIHRDLKPSNLMVGKYGEVYVMDWGLARVRGQSDHHDLRLQEPPQTSSLRTDRRESRNYDLDSPLITMDGSVLGTPSYMPPEQAEGRVEDMGPASDVYSMGAVMYELISGRIPYVPETGRISPRTVHLRVLDGPPTPLAELSPGCPGDLVAICEKAMARVSSDRYPVMEAIAEDLRAFLEQRVVSAYESGAWAEFRKTLVRNKRWSTATAAFLISLLLLSVWAVVERGRSESRAREASENLERALAAAQEWYLSAVGGCYSEIKRGEAGYVQRQLDACPTEHRGWEWQFLQSIADTSAWGFTPKGKPSSISFSPDQEKLLIGTETGEVEVWPIGAREPSRRLLVATDRVRSIRINPESDLFVVTTDSRASIWSARSWDLKRELDPGRLLCCYSSPTHWLVAMVQDEGLVVHDILSSTSIRRGWGALTGAFLDHENLLLSSGKGGIRHLDLAANTSRRLINSFSLLYSNQSGSCYSFEFDKWKKLSLDASTAELTTVQMSWPQLPSPDVHAIDGNSVVWAKGPSIADTSNSGFYCGHSSAVTRIVVDRPGRRLAAISKDGAVRVWHRGLCGLSVRLFGVDGDVEYTVVSVDPVSKRVFAANPTPELWDSESVEAEQLPLFDRKLARDACFLPDGRFLTLDETGAVNLWSSASDRELLWSTPSNPGQKSMALSPEGRSVALFGGTESGVDLYRIQLGSTPRKIEVGDPSTKAVASFVSETAVLIGSAQRAEIWDAEASRPSAAISFEGEAISCAIYARTTQKAILGTASGKILVLDKDLNSVVYSKSAHSGEITSLCLTNSEDRVFSGGADRVVIVWNYSSDLNRVLSLDHEVLYGVHGPIQDLAIAPDDTFLAVAAGPFLWLWGAHKHIKAAIVPNY